MQGINRSRYYNILPPQAHVNSGLNLECLQQKLHKHIEILIPNFSSITMVTRNSVNSILTKAASFILQPEIVMSKLLPTRTTNVSVFPGVSHKCFNWELNFSNSSFLHSALVFIQQLNVTGFLFICKTEQLIKDSYLVSKVTS